MSETGQKDEMHTRDRGQFRILIEGNDDPQSRNQYFEVLTYNPDGQSIIRREIIYVRDSRIAYNNAIKRHGKKLLNVENLETGRLVVGGR